MIKFDSKNDNLSTHLPVLLDGFALELIPHERFLGIQLDHKLKWSVHIENIANSISRKIGMLCQIRKFTSQRVSKLLYNSIIQPHLTYGIALWGGNNGPGISRLNKLQKKAIRIITGASRMDHSEPRLKNSAFFD